MDLESITDIYIPSANPEKAIAFPGPVVDIFKQHPDHIEQIMTKTASSDQTRMRITIDQYTYRLQRRPTPDDEFLVLRRIDNKILNLQDIGLKKQVVNQLRDPRLKKGGLIIICGQAGNGKSTTCASIIHDRLEMFGGVCNTVEYPAEAPLNGMHGNGLCLQRDVNSTEEFHEAVSDALRCYPTQSSNILLIGEVLDSDIASTVLRSSVNGHLVITTMHSGTVIQALQGIVSLASKKMGVVEARELLANSFSIALHQTLKKKEDSDELKLYFRFLCDTDSVVGQIRNQDRPLSMLSTEYQKQYNLLKKNMKIEVRRHDSSQ